MPDLSALLLLVAGAAITLAAGLVNDLITKRSATTRLQQLEHATSVRGRLNDAQQAAVLDTEIDRLVQAIEAAARARSRWRPIWAHMLGLGIVYVLMLLVWWLIGLTASRTLAELLPALLGSFIGAAVIFTFEVRRVRRYRPRKGPSRPRP